LRGKQAWPTSLLEKLTEFQEKWFKHMILRKKFNKFAGMFLLNMIL